jgi:hypothetical protein
MYTYVVDCGAPLLAIAKRLGALRPAVYQIEQISQINRFISW